MKFRFINIVAVFVFSLLLVGCSNGGSKITIVSNQSSLDVQVEVARTAEEKRVGLMSREELSDHTGMFFVYSEGSRPIIWMKNMLMPIDIVFIGEDRKISHIEKSVPPCEAVDDSQCDRYGSLTPSSWILELPAGYTMRHDIELGDQIIIPLGI